MDVAAEALVSVRAPGALLSCNPMCRQSARGVPVQRLMAAYRLAPDRTPSRICRRAVRRLSIVVHRRYHDRRRAFSGLLRCGVIDHRFPASSVASGRWILLSRAGRNDKLSARD